MIQTSLDPYPVDPMANTLQRGCCSLTLDSGGSGVVKVPLICSYGNSRGRVVSRGFLIFLSSNLLAWKSSKQKTVACSFTESEFKAIANACVEIIWLVKLLGKLGFNFRSHLTFGETMPVQFFNLQTQYFMQELDIWK